MALLRSSLLLALVISLLAPPIAGAQNPWTVKVYSSMNPLPIGVCGAVRLDIMDPATRATPRRPTGDNVTITDFDVTVTSPAGNSVAPHWVTAYNLLACGCQTGSVGDFGVVTATYPAQALPDRARIPGVSFQVKGDFSLSKAQNGVNPAGCSTPSVAPVVAVPALPVSPTSVTRTATTPISLAPATMPIPVRAPAPPPAPVAAPVNTIPTKVSTIPAASVPSSPLVVTGEPLPQIPPEILAAWARLGIPASADSSYGATIEELKRVLTAWMTATGQTGLIPLAAGTTVGRTVTPAPTPASAPSLPSSTGTLRSPLSGTPLPSQPVGGAPVPQGLAAGLVPTGLRLLPSVPIIASLEWDSMPNAVTYTLWRGDGVTPSIELATVSAFAAKTLRDIIPDPRITYRYTLAAKYADGTSAQSPAVLFTSPPLKNPTGFTAKHTGDGNVDFQWQAVDGAVNYRLDGPGIPGAGFYTSETSTRYQQIPGGANSWKLTALYEGNFADYANPAIATAVVRVLPPRSQQWLTKNNGAGNASLTAAHYAQLCPNSPRGCSLDDLSSLAPVIRTVPGSSTSASYSSFPSLWGIDIAPSEAVYGNVDDLGFGRRTNCRQVLKRPPAVPGLLTICSATSHGAGQGETGFADPETITRAAAGEVLITEYVDYTGWVNKVYEKNPWGVMPRSGTVIIRDGAGAFFFYAFTVGRANPVFDTKMDWSPWAVTPAPLSSLALDSEGAKAVPHSCLSCHGGRWDPTTKRVFGASFLPLEPGVLVFGVTKPGDRTGYERGKQEENVRSINQMIAASAPGSAVANYINGLYNGAVGSTGAVARDDYVPTGWAAQPGLYRSVVKPFCASCHLAAPSAVNFASWANFLQNKAAIYNSVCVARTMPHAEIPYRAFWTKDTGPIYLPGLLAVSLGYSGCP